MKNDTGFTKEESDKLWEESIDRVVCKKCGGYFSTWRPAIKVCDCKSATK